MNIRGVILLLFIALIFGCILFSHIDEVIKEAEATQKMLINVYRSSKLPPKDKYDMQHLINTMRKYDYVQIKGPPWDNNGEVICTNPA